MVTYRQAHSLLQTYTLDELLELNELDHVDVLEFLIEQKFIKIPDLLPVDYNA